MLLRSPSSPPTNLLLKVASYANSLLGCHDPAEVGDEVRDMFHSMGLQFGMKKYSGI